MKRVKSYEQFRNESLSYYEIGKRSRQSIVEMQLNINGIATPSNESATFRRLDEKLIDCLLLEMDGKPALDSLLEEFEFGKVWQNAKDLVSKGVDIAGNAVSSFKDFIGKVGNVIKDLFDKIKNFLKKVWQGFVPIAKKTLATIKSKFTENIDRMTQVAEQLADDQGQAEVLALTKDVGTVCKKFAGGELANTSDEAAQRISDEAKDYDGVDDDAEIGRLIDESVARRSSVRKVLTALKGFVHEGGDLDELAMVLEADEALASEGDKVEYTTDDGRLVNNKVLRIEKSEDGKDMAVMKDKSGNEFKKPVSELKKLTGAAKVAAAFTGRETEKKGIFGWIVEAVGIVINWKAKLTEYAIKGGTNGLLMTLSGFARGWKNMFKYVLMGTIAGLVYHIIHGLQEVVGGEHEEKPEEKKEVGAQSEDAEIEKPEAKPQPAAAKPKINLSRTKVDTSKVGSGSMLSGLDGMFQGAAGGIVGGLIYKALSLKFHVIKIVLEVIMVGIGIFELIGAACQIDKVAKGMPKICSMQMDAHHWLEGKFGGGGAAH
jgi:hypothetical protein